VKKSPKHMPALQALDCLCAGIVVADHVCEPVDHVPAPGELVLTRRMDLSIGGCASNVAVGLAKLGRRVSVVGCVGDDVFGRFISASLANAGVKTGRLRELPGVDTSGTLVINSRGEDRRFVHSVGANARFTGAELSPELVRSARVLYLGGYFLMNALSPEAVAAIFCDAQSAGVVTLLDVVIPGPGEYWDRLAPLLPHTDVFLPNDDESRAMTGLADPLAQARAFRQAGARTAVVTCGKGGAVLVGAEGEFQSGAYAVDFVDGTGSGDAFVAGYIHGLLNNLSPTQCLRYGSALGASCVRATGATAGALGADELADFVASHELPVRKL
jgi:sugar/nucleoside kinase (ribokinase family)